MQNRNLLQKNIEKTSRDVIVLDIRKKVAYLKRKYDTSNPFDLASCLGITVIFEDLGTINGYYNKQLRMKQIHINHNLPEHIQKLTCAHELGHALLHPNSNTPFLRNITFYSVDKLEIEANTFAAELLISDDDIAEYKNCTVNQFARMLGYREELIRLKLNMK